MRVLHDTVAELGEGAFWHPERQAFFWFDILHKRLHAVQAGTLRVWEMPEIASALGWVDRDRVVLSTETGLHLFDLETGEKRQLAAIGANDRSSRSNDGRADPWGGFWASVMGRRAEAGRGEIWRWWEGELRQVVNGLTIPNAICFDLSLARAYYADTARGIVWKQPLDPKTGWPEGVPDVFLDLSSEGLNPDGAVVDAEGRFWNAQWGAGRVAIYGSDGRFLNALSVPARQPSCPAFGGPGYRHLHVTSAWEGMSQAVRAADPNAGKSFVGEVEAQGLPEPRVRV